MKDGTWYTLIDGEQLNLLSSSTQIPYFTNLKIYPVPSKGKINVELPKKDSGIINVYTLDGKLLKSESINNEDDLSLDLTPFNGMFILEFKSNDGKLYYHKIEVIK